MIHQCEIYISQIGDDFVNDTKIIFKKIACKGKYSDDQAIPDVIAYIMNPNKTPSKIIYGVYADMDNIAESMIKVSKDYKKYKRLRLHHFVLTFEPEYKTQHKLLKKIARRICDHFGRVYQIVSALHEDTQNPHIHFVFNAVSFVNGYKYRGGKKEYAELIKNINRILFLYDLPFVIPVKYFPTPLDLHE